MSSLTDQMYANVATSPRGMITGTFEDPIRRSWGEVHDEARRMAGALSDMGVEPGTSGRGAGRAIRADVAPLAQAIWIRGASLTMLAQPTPRTDLAMWLADTHRAARTIGAALTIVGAPFADAAEPLNAAGQDVVMLDELRNGPDIEPLHPDESAIAMYQLTSGSTVNPQGGPAHPRQHRRQLERPVHGDGRRCGHRCDGQLAAAVARHGHARVPCAADAVRRRTRRLQTRGIPAPTGTVGGPDQPLPRTITSGPNFAYALLALTLERAVPGRFDLSSLRVAINGAEPIDARDTRRLAEAGARFGLRPGAITPAYGMAEATLAITFDNSPHINVDRISRSDLQERALATPDAGADACGVVSVGLPVAGMEIRGRRRSIPACIRRVASGRSRFAVRRCPADTSPSTGGARGPSVTAGYIRATLATSTNTAACMSAAVPRT